jgi:peroxiredoxin
MDFTKMNRFFWLLLAVIIILVAAAAVADRAIHASAVTPLPGTTAEASSQTPVMTGTRIGLAAPDFTLPTTGDKEFKLSDYRGKKVILNFWASWCGPCRLEIPSFKKIHAKYNDGSVVVVAVSSLDNPDSTANFVTANGMDFVVPLDPRGVVSGLYNIRGMPTTYFIDDRGIIKSVKIGPFISVEEIEERLDSFK